MSRFLNIKLKSDHEGLKANQLYSAEKLDDGTYNIWIDGGEVLGITEAMLVDEDEETEVASKKKGKPKTPQVVEEAKVITPFFQNVKSKVSNKNGVLKATIAFLAFIFLLILIFDTCERMPDKDIERVSDKVPASYQQDSKRSNIVIEDESKANIDFIDEFVDALVAKSKATYVEQKVPITAINSIDYNNPVIRNAARELLLDQLARIIQNSSLQMNVLDTLNSEEYNLNKAYKNQIHSKIIK